MYIPKVDEKIDIENEEQRYAIWMKCVLWSEKRGKY